MRLALKVIHHLEILLAQSMWRPSLEIEQHSTPAVRGRERDSAPEGSQIRP